MTLTESRSWNFFESQKTGANLWGTALFLAALFGAVGMILIPLPAATRDAFFCANLVFSALVLAATIASPRALSLTSFPGLLLAAALFRVALGVGAARAILSGEDPGRVVEAFGNTVSQGRPVTGLVLFLILQITHLAVMTKGSERVAEVAARFSLDALPGKQMSIDADLRAGLISDEEARSKRKALNAESRFYGAMDGALKFIKGESVTTFALVAVNLIGGFAVGYWQRGLSLERTFSLYAALAIGDGLASQIPSLLLALASGFLVTRPEGENGKGALGEEILGQFFIHKTPLLAGSVLSFALAALPGFPGVPFIVLGCAAATASVLPIRERNETGRPVAPFTASEMNLPGLPSAFTLELGFKAARLFMTQAERAGFTADCERVREALSAKCGFPLPELEIRASSHEELAADYRILVHGLPSESGNLEAYADSGLDGRQLLLWRVGLCLKRHACEFLGLKEIRVMLDALESHSPDLVREVIPRKLTLPQLAEILRKIAEERVPLTDWRQILETLALTQTEGKDAVALSESVRFGLRRAITRLHVPESGLVDAILLSPELEKEIGEAVRSEGCDCYLALSGARIREISLSFQEAVRRAGAKSVVLTNSAIRRYVRKIIEHDLPHAPVLSFQELEPGVGIRGRATVGLAAIEVPS